MVAHQAGERERDSGGLIFEKSAGYDVQSTNQLPKVYHMGKSGGSLGWPGKLPKTVAQGRKIC